MAGWERVAGGEAWCPLGHADRSVYWNTVNKWDFYFEAWLTLKKKVCFINIDDSSCHIVAVSLP